MADAAFEVQPLFAEPIFRMDVSEAIGVDQIAFIQNLPMVRNRTNLISDDLYIFERPELASLKSAVHAALDVFAREVMGIPQKLYVTQSWSLINPPGVGMHGHSHSNSVVSGSLYYASLPEPGSQMVFDRHKVYQQLQLAPEDSKTNIYNAPLRAISPRQGEVVLFASNLQHYVEPNPSSQDRHSIAFNSFVRGKIGNFRDVSELTL